MAFRLAHVTRQVDTPRVRLTVQGLRGLRTAPHSLEQAGQSPAAVRAGVWASIQRYSSSAGSRQGVEEGAGAAPAHGEDDLFPWRMAPQEERFRGLSILQRVYSRLWQSVLKTSMRDIIADEGFEAGSKMAFTSVTRALFKMQASDAVDDRFQSADLRPGEHPEVTPPIASAAWSAEETSTATNDDEDISKWESAIDSRLLDFVRKSGEATRARNAIPFYRLHHAQPSPPHSVLIVLGKTRQELTPQPRVEVPSPPGFTILFDEQVADTSGLKPSDAPDYFKNYMSHVSDNVEKNAVRLDVDMLCFETFYVRDRESNEVIQGSETPEVRLHRLRLEASPGHLLHPAALSWKVVDLDNWLDGNRYW